MQKSLHPPHVVDNGNIVPNAAFPFCKYDGDDEDGVLVGEYGDRFCNAFQVSDARIQTVVDAIKLFGGNLDNLDLTLSWNNNRLL